MKKKHKNILFGYFNFLWLLRSAQPSPESCLTIWSFSPSCLLTGCLLKKRSVVLAWSNLVTPKVKSKPDLVISIVTTVSNVVRYS